MATTIFLPGFHVSAQENRTEADSNTSTNTTVETKADAGNALNAFGSAQATDSDGDGYGEAAIREGGQTIDAGTVPEQEQNTPSGDIDADGYSDASVTKPDYLDDDSDDDGITDDASKEIEVIEYRDGGSQTLLIKDVTKATPKLMEALSIDVDSPLLYQGITMSVAANSCDSKSGEDCDDTDDDLTSASFGIMVSGVEVRGWDPERKEELQSRASAMMTIETPNSFGIWLTTKVLENESINEVRVLHDSIEVKFESKARLLGFIPIVMPTTARLGRIKISDVTLERSSESEIELDYPWYGFLVRNKSVGDSIATDMTEIATNYDASQKKEVKFKAGKALAETVK